MLLINITAESNVDCVLSKTIKLKGSDMVCPAIAEITVPVVIRVKSLDHTFLRLIVVHPPSWR